MAQRSFRLPLSMSEAIAAAIREDGYASFAAFLRTAIQNELKRRHQPDLLKVEQAIAASVDRQQNEIQSLRAVLQAHFALTDALARVILHCMPEPPADVHSEALARAKERHNKLLKMTALSMKGNARAILAELVTHEQ